MKNPAFHFGSRLYVLHNDDKKKKFSWLRAFSLSVLSYCARENPINMVFYQIARCAFHEWGLTVSLLNFCLVFTELINGTCKGNTWLTTVFVQFKILLKHWYEKQCIRCVPLRVFYRSNSYTQPYFATVITVGSVFFQGWILRNRLSILPKKLHWKKLGVFL